MPATTTRPADPLQTNHSTRRLSEVARHVVIPDGIVSTGWPAVEAKVREFGDTFDEWQRGAGRVILGKREDGIYAATVGGVTLSIPRQVAKTFLVLRIIVALCALFPGLKVIWTAHRTRTATNTFKSLQSLCRRKSVAPYIDHIRTTNGEQEVGFRNGSVIMFGAREAGFGRGFDEVDVEVFDEAQILTEKALEDMVAATNQSRHPHGALLFFMGTPPRPVDPGEAFTERRKEALSGKSEDAVYIECSADPDADPDDHEQWRVANPSFPHRTPLRSMLRLRKNLPSDESWRREALGIWDEDDAAPGLNYNRWKALVDASAERGGSQVFGLSTAPDRSWAAVAVAWTRPDGDVQVMLADYRPTTSWVKERLDELGARWGGRILTDPESQDLYEAAERVPLARAQASLDDAITAGTVRHGNETALNTAVRGAKWRKSGDGRVLDRKGDLEISPAVAAALAVHGVMTGDNSPPNLW
jgi:phage terminase large subunit-like protein